jgi:hypothetical protein
MGFLDRTEKSAQKNPGISARAGRLWLIYNEAGVSACVGFSALPFFAGFAAFSAFAESAAIAKSRSLPIIMGVVEISRT